MGIRADLTRKRFGRLVAITHVGHCDGHVLWKCRCDCGEVIEVIATNLKTGNVKSCGCYRRDAGKARLIDLTGQRFGRLAVLRFKERANSRTMFECLCDCGSVVDVWSNALRRGVTQSCGCLHRDAVTKHGRTDTPEHECWANMIQRCFNQRNPAYKDYGGRGITVCNRWRGKRGFENFFADVGPRPSAKHSIDRYPDNDGDYKPGNVRWATVSQQHRNHRANRFVSYRGRNMTGSDFAREIGWSPAMVRHHLRAGRTPEWIAKRAKSRR